MAGTESVYGLAGRGLGGIAEDIPVIVVACCMNGIGAVEGGSWMVSRVSTGKLRTEGRTCERASCVSSSEGSSASAGDLRMISRREVGAGNRA